MSDRVTDTIKSLEYDLKNARSSEKDQREKAGKLRRDHDELQAQHKALKSMYDSALSLINRLQMQLKLESKDAPAKLRAVK